MIICHAEYYMDRFDYFIRSLEEQSSLKIVEYESKSRLIENLISEAKFLDRQIELMHINLTNLYSKYEFRKVSADNDFEVALTLCPRSTLRCFLRSAFKDDFSHVLRSKALAIHASAAIYTLSRELILALQNSAKIQVRIMKLFDDYHVLKNEFDEIMENISNYRSTHQTLRSTYDFFFSLYYQLDIFVTLSNMKERSNKENSRNFYKIEKTFEAIAKILTNPKFETVRTSLDPTGISALVADCLLHASYKNATATTIEQCAMITITIRREPFMGRLLICMDSIRYANEEY